MKGMKSVRDKICSEIIITLVWGIHESFHEELLDKDSLIDGSSRNNYFPSRAINKQKENK